MKMKKTIILAIIVILILPAYIIFGATKGSNTKNEIKPLYYKKILINVGDTLTSISEKNNTSNMSTTEFISYLKAFNKLNSDNIYYGNYIIVPIYEEIDVVNEP